MSNPNFGLCGGNLPGGMDAPDADVGREKAAASFKRDGDAADGVRISSVQPI